MFSGTIKIVDLDDYIKPSQECIKPLIQASKSNKMQIDAESSDFKVPSKTASSIKTSQEEINKNLVELYNKPSQIKPDLIKKSVENTAKVSLNDCLACSGCVTTAESILVEQHSVIDFNDKIKKFPCTVITISPQARSSIARYYGLNDLQTHISLMILFSNLGAGYFFDQSLGIDFAIQEAQKEFIGRFKEAENGNTKTFPLLCSECPGWVCFAEKIVRDAVIPHMSTVKSPQQIMGNLVKDILSEKIGLKKEEVYHVSIQPCYDKKLEASRREFERESIKEVDTVLTAGEIINIITKAEEDGIIPNGQKFENIYNFYLNEYSLPKLQENMLLEELLLQKKESENKDLSKQDLTETRLRTNALEKNSSHAYLEAVVRGVARNVYGANDNEVELNYKPGKNPDIEEIAVLMNGKELFTTARIYGLRNINTLTRNLKKGICKYKYVEVMACPSGCLNGGGQLKARDSEIKAKDLVKILLNTMNDQSCKSLSLPEENASVGKIWGDYGNSIHMQATFKAVDDDTFAASKLKW